MVPLSENQSPKKQSRKKVIVRGTSGDVVPGYLPTSRFLRPAAEPGERDNRDSSAERNALDLLDLAGRTLPIPLSEIKWVCFVRDFNLDDRENPERLTRRSFLARPRSEGLWVRITYPGGDRMEGLAALDASLLDGLLDDAGLLLTPPDERSNTHLIYIPRCAIATLQVLGVITTPTRVKAVRDSTPNTQADLFSLEP